MLSSIVRRIAVNYVSCLCSFKKNEKAYILHVHTCEAALENEDKKQTRLFNNFGPKLKMLLGTVLRCNAMLDGIKKINIYNLVTIVKKVYSLDVTESLSSSVT